MTIATYSELVSEVETFLNRTDVSGRIPTAIRLFEGWCNRELRTPDTEATDTTVTVAGEDTIALPADFRQIRSLHLSTDPIRVMEYMAPDAMRATYVANQQSKPLVYTIEGESLVLAPVPDGEYTLVMTYYEEIPALTSGNTTNWLLAKHPDAYLAGTLAYMYGFLRDNDEAAKWQGVLDSILSSVNSSGASSRRGLMQLRSASFA